MDDREIIKLYFDRNETAISETEKKYGRLCHKIASGIISDAQDINECLNDVSLSLWQAIPPESPNNLCAFVAKIARNTAITKLRYLTASKRNRNFEISLSELDEIIPDKTDYYNIEDKQLGRWISDFLYSIDETARNIFIRKYWFFDSVESLSRQFSCSETKIKSVLFRTRKKLKHYLSEE